jgi:hypothetical protein
MSHRREFIKCVGAAAVGAMSVPVAAQEKPQECQAQVADLKQRLEASSLAHYPQLITYLKALQARFGAGVVEVVRQSTIDSARQEMAEAALAKGRRGLPAVKRTLWDQLGGKVEFTVVEDGPEKLAYKVTRCRYAETVRKAGGTSEQGFALLCAYDIGYCQGLNPKLTFTRTKTLMAGDDCCNHTYELRKEDIG